MKKTRVLLIDDHTLFRQGIATIVNAEPDIELKLHCGSIGEALFIIAAEVVDLVLLDIDLGQERGIDFLAQARANGFRGPVLILTARLSKDEMEVLERYGISGVILKNASSEALVHRIRDVTGRERSLEPPRPVVKPHQDSLRRLSQRETDVLRLVVEGHANKEIASQIGVSEATIKALIQNLFHKTGTHTRSQLVRVALEDYHDQH